MRSKKQRIDALANSKAFYFLSAAIILKIDELVMQHKIATNDCGRFEARETLLACDEVKASHMLIAAMRARSTMPVLFGDENLTIFQHHQDGLVGFASYGNGEHAAFQFLKENGLQAVSSPLITEHGNHAYLLVRDGEIVQEMGLFVENRNGKPLAQLYSGSHGIDPYSFSRNKFIMLSGDKDLTSHRAGVIEVGNQQEQHVASPISDLLPRITETIEIHPNPAMEAALEDFETFCRTTQAEKTIDKNSAFVSFYKNDLERIGFEEAALEFLQKTILDSAPENIFEDAVRLFEDERRAQELARERIVHDIQQQAPKPNTKKKSSRKKLTKKQKRAAKKNATKSTHAPEPEEYAEPAPPQEEVYIERGRMKWRGVQRMINNLMRAQTTLVFESSQNGSHIQIKKNATGKRFTLVKTHGKHESLPKRFLKELFSS
jgi:hypothetical protein